jgi:thiol-disulfide isomerase/thioredoxin
MTGWQDLHARAIAGNDTTRARVTGELPAPSGSFACFSMGDTSKDLARVSFEDGQFSVSLAVQAPRFVHAAYECGKRNNSTLLLLYPGSRVHLRVDTAGNMHWSGDGAAVTRFIEERRPASDTLRARLARFKEHDRGRSGYLMHHYRDREREIRAAPLPEEEKRVLVGYYQNELLNNLYAEILFARSYGKIFPHPLVREDYSAPVLDLEIVPEITCLDGWHAGVEEFLHARLRAGLARVSGPSRYTTEILQGLPAAGWHEDYLVIALKQQAMTGQRSGFRERVEAARPAVQRPENARALDELLLSLPQSEPLPPGSDLSGFTFQALDGRSVSLGDFKGNYIFIDLWATDCNPCIGEIPYIREMEHRFAGQPIVWVSISLDLHEKPWQDFVEQEKLTGVQLRCDRGMQHPFAERVGLRGIPHFMLLDKHGKVIDPCTLRPSNPILSELLEWHLTHPPTFGGTSTPTRAR